MGQCLFAYGLPRASLLTILSPNHGLSIASSNSSSRKSGTHHRFGPGNRPRHCPFIRRRRRLRLPHRSHRSRTPIDRRRNQSRRRSRGCRSYHRRPLARRRLRPRLHRSPQPLRPRRHPHQQRRPLRPGRARRGISPRRFRKRDQRPPARRVPADQSRTA